jgi:hypothetical protein
MILSKRAWFIVGCMMIVPPVFSSNTAGVHGPNVNPNDTSIQLRIALSPADNDNQVDNWAYRFHAQHSLNDKVRVRLTTQFRDRGDFQYDYLRGELLYNFKKATGSSKWSSAVRFDFRTRRGGRAEDFATHWVNQWSLANGYRARALLVGNLQFGSNRTSNDLGLSTRFSLSKKREAGYRLGAQLFNSYGRLGSFGSFDDQNHQFGPFVAGKLGGLKYQARWLFGLSDGSRNNNIEVRFNKSF